MEHSNPVRDSHPEPHNAIAKNSHDTDPNSRNGPNSSLHVRSPAQRLADDIANEYRSPPLTEYYAYSTILRLAAQDTTRAIPNEVTS